MNPFRAYLDYQKTQLNWVRNHPVQWLALNAAIIAVTSGVIVYQSRKMRRRMEQDMETIRQDVI